MPSDESKYYRKLFVTNHRKQLNKLIKRRLFEVTGEVLVLGAGHTDYSKYFNLDQCSLLQTDLDYYGPHIAELIDINDLDGLDRQFDVVIAFEVFEHVEDLANAVNQIHTVLKPKGKLLASMPFLFHIHADPNDFVRLTKQGIEHQFSRFSHIEISAFGSRLHVLLDLITTANKPMAALRILNHLPTDKIFPSVSESSPSGYFFECHK